MTWYDPTQGPHVPLDDAEAIRRANESLSHSASIIHVGPNAPTSAVGSAAKNVPDWKRWFDTVNKLDKIWSPTHSKWITLTPLMTRDDGAGTRALTSFGDLTAASVGPARTIDTGTTAYVDIGAQMTNDTPGEICLASFAVSGATTAAAADAISILVVDIGALGRRFLVTGLTAGSNTFTMKYRVTAGTGTFERRNICVTPIAT